MADAVRHRRPVRFRYTAADGRASERTLHPYGLVAHAGRWYVTGADPGLGEERTFRLDRIADARTRPGSFAPPADFDPARRLLAGFAAAPYRHHVVLRVHGAAGQVRARLPASLAAITEIPEAGGGGPEVRVDLHAEELDWLPGLLATLGLPFVIEQPGELRTLVAALAARLAAAARVTEAASGTTE